MWRRVQVQDCTLTKLHEVIQIAMGYSPCGCLPKAATKALCHCCPTGSATISLRSPYRWNRTPTTSPGSWPKSFDQTSTATTLMRPTSPTWAALRC
ncbi:MAG: hypothetical protein ACOX1P_03940 [Thermoguttaceae bacterium]